MDSQKGHLSLEWLFNPRLRIGYHILFWVFVFLEELLDGMGFLDAVPLDRYFLFFMVLDMLMVYISIYIFLPRLLLKGKVAYYIIASILLIISVIVIQNGIDIECEDCAQVSTAAYIYSFIYSSFIIGAATGIKLFKHYVREQKNINAIKQDQYESELVYLKDQMNPHFLFNSLNGIYVLNQRDPQLAGDALLKLSDILRYQLYDSDKEQVLLNDELNYINKFLALEQMRKKNLNIEVSASKDAYSYTIAPYILMPFIENAIKHSASIDEEDVSINVDVTTSGDSEMTFSVENTIPQNPLEHETGGIGVRNVRRRLDLVYPENYTMTVDESQSSYKVTLIIHRLNTQ